MSFALTVISYFFYTRVFFNAPGAIGMTINSDSLVLPQMGWEMSHVPDAWRHFQWPRVPSLFPDMLWFWGAEGLGVDWRLAWNGFFLFSLSLMTLCLGAVVWRMGTLSFSRALFVSSLTLAAYVAFVSSGAHVSALSDISGLLEIFLPAFHGSSFMLSLLAATTANIACDRGNRIADFVPTACLCAVSTFSDPMFITTFAVPFFLSTRMFAVRHRGANSVTRSMCQGIGPPLFLLFSCLVGFVGQEFLYKQSLSGTVKHFPLVAFPKIIYFSLFSVRASFCLVFVLLSVIPFLKIRSEICGNKIEPCREMLFYQGYTASIISLFILSVSYVDLSIYRYALPATWWSIIFIISNIDSKSVRKISNGFLVSLPFIILFFIFMGWKGNRNALDGWHAPLESCISRNHDRLGLRDGLAGYWVSRKIEASSDWKLQVEQVTGGNHMFIWGNNPDLYTHGLHRFDKPPYFNYVIDDGKGEMQGLYREMGPPSHILHCPEADVLVFSRQIRVE